MHQDEFIQQNGVKSFLKEHSHFYSFCMFTKYKNTNIEKISCEKESTSKLQYECLVIRNCLPHIVTFEESFKTCISWKNYVFVVIHVYFCFVVPSSLITNNGVTMTKCSIRVLPKISQILLTISCHMCHIGQQIWDIRPGPSSLYQIWCFQPSFYLYVFGRKHHEIPA